MMILDLLLLIGVIQGFFLTIGLFVKYRQKKKHNPYFFALVLTITLAMLGKMAFTVERYYAMPHFWYFLDLTAFAIGPLWYMTILNSVNTRPKLQWDDYLLLSPILYFIGFLVYLLSFSREEVINNEHENGSFIHFYLFCLFVMLVNGGFLTKSTLMIRQFKSRQFPVLLKQGQMAFMTVLALWLFCFLLGFAFSDPYSINLSTYQFGFVALALVTLGMAFLALIKPNTYYFLTQTFDKSETYVLTQVANGVLKVFEQEQPFLHKDFSLQKLADKIGANTVMTSKAINQVLNTSFSDLINEHRVHHFINLAQREEYDHLTLWAIAQDAGFGNKVSFFKAFKKIKGTTPKAFLSGLPKPE